MARRVTASMAMSALLAIPAATGSREADDTATQLRVLVEDAVRQSPSIPGMVLHVEAPGRDLDLSVAAGVADRVSGTSLTPDAGYRIASNTKTFTAAAILRLVEEGTLILDEPISGLLATDTLDVLRRGGYRPDKITVRHLLQHQGGIYDYATDPAFEVAVLTDPSKRWNRLEQVRFAMDHGAPVGAPGAVFAYSDTGYVLLGEIIELATGVPLAEAYDLLLDYAALRMGATYLESLEPAPPGVAPRAHQYFGELDTFEIDPSIDLYGGGGLVSTVDDLSAFYRGLLGGDVFTDSGTLDTMLEIPAANAAADAAMGLFRLDVDGEVCWSHAGFWGTFVMTCPQIDVTLAAAWGQVMTDDGFDGDVIFQRAFELATDS